MDQEVQLPVGKACLELVEIELETIEKEDACDAIIGEIGEGDRLGNKAGLWNKVSQQNHEENARNKRIYAGSGTDAVESADSMSHKFVWLSDRYVMAITEP